VVKAGGVSTLPIIKNNKKLNKMTPTFPIDKVYKVYTALMGQVSTNDPTATVLQNTLGGTVVWTRNDVGDYSATLTDAFPVGKVFISAANVDPDSGLWFIQAARLNDNVIRVYTFNYAAEGASGGPWMIEIRVYS